MKLSLSSLRLAGLVCLLGTAPLATAQNQLSLGELERGQLALNLNLTEERQVEQDTLNASLQFTAQGRDRRALQNEVNENMAKALAELREHDGIEFNTGYYQVYIVEAGRPGRADVQNPVYRAQQSVQLESRDSSLMLEVIGKLQEMGLVVNGLYYSLSREAQATVENELLEAALQNLQLRAQGAATALGKSQADLVEVSMSASSGGMGFYAPRAVMSAMDAAEKAVPVADPGQTTVSVSVSARAILSP
jgi:predicted secreted protein